MSDSATWLLLVDLDGTVRYGPGQLGGRFVNQPHDVQVFPEAPGLLQAWRANGGHVVGVTNQGGVALGFMDLYTARLTLDETDRQCGGVFNNLLMCPHHPGVGSELEASGTCWCRKPRPGLVYQHFAANPGVQYLPDQTLMVGDRSEDRGLAQALDVRFLRADLWRLGRYPNRFRHMLELTA